RLLAVERCHSFLRAAGLDDGVTLEFEVDPHVLPKARVVIDQQDDRADAVARPGAGALEELVEIAAPVPPVAARGIERRHAALIRPFANRALSDAKELRGLAQGQPVSLARGHTPLWVPKGHAAWN